MTAASSQEVATNGSTSEFDATQLGDKLVSAPRKVAQLDINYAKAAKKMDVKKLKSSMWNLLVKPEKDKVSSHKQSSGCIFLLLSAVQIVRVA